MRLLTNLIFAIPVFGWMIKSATRGGHTEQAFFIANLAMLWLFAFLQFGFAGLIFPGLAAATLGLLLVILLSGSDLLET